MGKTSGNESKKSVYFIEAKSNPTMLLEYVTVGCPECRFPNFVLYIMQYDCYRPKDKAKSVTVDYGQTSGNGQK